MAAGTARVSMELSYNGPGRSFDITGGGVADFVHRSGEMTLNGPTGTAGLRVVNGTAYEQLPGQAWHQVPMSSVSAGSGPTDPASYLAWLQGASGGIKRVGPAEVRGVSTTEYQANVDLAKLARDPGQALTAREMASLLGSTEVPLNLWVDNEGLARQVRFDLTARPGSSMARQGLGLTVQIDFYDFGISVIVAPPT